MRSNTTQRNHWTHLGIGACALLLPPLTLGAAFYSMLASPDDGAVAGASAVRPESMRDTVQHRAPSADPQPAAQATQSAVGQPARPEGMARGPDSVPVQDPVQVTVQVTSAPPAGANSPPPAGADGALRGALSAEPSQSAPADVSTALLPRALAPSSQMPLPMPPPRMPTARIPAAQAADPPSPESSPAPPPVARKQGRPSYLANLAGRNGTRESQSARRNAQPQPQQAFSLKNWLQQQLGIRPHNTRG